MENQSASGFSKNLITVHNPHSTESEQFRQLKNKIFFPESGKRCRTILITSAESGEGKTFVASNLAVSIALSIDEYVMLIDSDLRNPSIHKEFNLDNEEGLSSYLSEGRYLSDLLKKTFLKKLTILTGGKPPLNPSELISSDQMKKLIREVESRYDDRYIIIDSPPPNLSSESNALATYVDGVIVVIKQDYTKKENIKKVIDIYGKEKILGVVKNYSKGLFGFDSQDYVKINNWKKILKIKL